MKQTPKYTTKQLVYRVVSMILVAAIAILTAITSSKVVSFVMHNILS